MEDINRLLDDFDYRRKTLDNLTFGDANSRISGFWHWLISEKTIVNIIDKVKMSVDASLILRNANRTSPPQVSNPEEVTAVGFHFLDSLGSKSDLSSIAEQYRVLPSFSTNDLMEYINAILDRFINPAFDFIRRELEKLIHEYEDIEFYTHNSIASIQPPPEILESLNKFKKENPFYQRNAFIMMKFGKTKAHKDIIDSITTTLNSFNLFGFRADDKEYHDDLFGNVLTYIYGCKFGIAVFERLEEDDFNPNVSLEVGYMRGLKKSICLLKDKTLPKLQTDLVGKLYKEFDPQSPNESIPGQLEKWLKDKDILTI